MQPAAGLSGAAAERNMKGEEKKNQDTAGESRAIFLYVSGIGVSGWNSPHCCAPEEFNPQPHSLSRIRRSLGMAWGEAVTYFPFPNPVVLFTGWNKCQGLTLVFGVHQYQLVGFEKKWDTDTPQQNLLISPL